MKEKKLWIDRDLSWVQFNQRVLEEAQRGRNPLMERLRFISIFESNFDEFYRVRVGALQDKALMEEDEDEDAGKETSRQLTDVFKATRQLLPRLDLLFAECMEDAVGRFVRLTEQGLSEEDRAALKQIFEREIAPFIAPFVIDKKHPFPFLENGVQVVGVTLQRKSGGVKFGLISVPKALPRAIFLPGRRCRFILLEDLIQLFAYKVFHRYEIVETLIFTIIRNADIDENEGLYDFDVDFRGAMSKLVELRGKLAPVELKYRGQNCDKILSHLKQMLYLSKKQLFCQTAPLQMGFLSLLEKRFPKEEHPELYYEPMPSLYPSCVDRTRPLLDQILEKDVLLSYPFDDIAMLLDLLEQAAADERVDRIQISLYRVASNSKIVQSLIDAAKRGKSVTCVVELRARFDEENNIDWSKRLEEAGCHVVYGLPGYKVHCKLLFIGLAQGGGVAQVGTGNFNEVTAKLYTDLALFTAHEGILSDVQEVFRCLVAGNFVEHSQHLLVAPLCLKNRLMELIDQEIEKARAGEPCGIVLKMNSLTDKDLVEKLVQASQAGVRVQMIVRGICCLTPGLRGRTENIEVRSIVGRLLEHSRIYAFGVGANRKFFISSADFMTRNTMQRVEVAVPVYDYKAKRKLAKILRLALSDNQKAWVLKSSGNYRMPGKATRAKPVNLQMSLFQVAKDEAMSAKDTRKSSAKDNNKKRKK